MKENKKDFQKYTFHNSKSKTRENMGLLLNGAGQLVTKDIKKAKVPNILFDSIFTSKNVFRNPRPLRLQRNSGARKT